MAAIDDLNTAVANLQTQNDLILAELATLKASNNDAAIKTATDAINAVTDKQKAAL